MSGTFGGCKFVLILTVLLITICLTLMAMCMEVAALVNPRWQVVNISDLRIVHEHGLWIDCIQKKKEGSEEKINNFYDIFIGLFLFFFFTYLLCKNFFKRRK